MATIYFEAMGIFKEALLAKAELGFSRDQKKLVVENIYKNSEDFSVGDLPDFKSACFFIYEELEEEMLESIWEYGLSASGLEEQVEQSEIVPFCAMNMDGLGVYWGQNSFQENNNWGVLCLDLKNGEGSDCPVIWVYKGSVIPWAASAASLALRVL